MDGPRRHHGVDGPRTGSGAAAAAARIFRGDATPRDRGRPRDRHGGIRAWTVRGRVAARPRPPRGYSAETRRRGRPRDQNGGTTRLGQRETTTRPLDARRRLRHELLEADRPVPELVRAEDAVEGGVVELVEALVLVSVITAPRPETCGARRSRPKVHVGVAATRVHGISASWPRRRRDSCPRNTRVAAAASPRFVSTEYPRRGRGVAATRVHGISASRPRRRRDSSERRPRREWNVLHVCGPNTRGSALTRDPQAPGVAKSPTTSY